MFDASYYRSIVSGKKRGPVALLLRVGLACAEPFYRIGVGWRNRQFDSGKRETFRVEVRVISVGNLTVGGTGKTPMVEWLARWFRSRNLRVAIISRGYGAEAGSQNDEALELEQKLPDVPHLQNPDRVEAANTAIEELESQVIVLDDAFQHRRIHRDLNIVLIDALEPFGYGHLLPRGLLREPARNLSRGDVVVLSRSDAVDETTRSRIRERVKSLAPDVDWVEVTHRPECYLSATGTEMELESLTGKRVIAFCGIGNPDGFRHTLREIGVEVIAFREFPDHHAYGRDDVTELAAWAEESGADAAICTHKDIVKLGTEQLGNCPLLALRIGLAISNGEADLTKHLEDIADQKDADASASASEFEDSP